MTRLALTCQLVGVGVLAARLPGVLAPASFRRYALAFPRSVWWGRILMIAVAGWAGWWMYQAVPDDWKWAAQIRSLVVMGVPLAYWLVIQYAEQFLALRSVAALLLLVAKLLVSAADSSDSPWRVVVHVLAYLWVVAGIWMAIAPHHFRDLIRLVMANDQRCRLACALGAAVGAALIALGWWVY